MKWITTLAVACLFFVACNNDANSNNDSDTVEMVTPPTNPTMNDTSRVGDTSSYERMQQRTDSTPR